MENHAGEVTIVEFGPQYLGAFKQLNEEWISKYFVLEDSDYKALDHAQEYIIDNGGFILVAILSGEAVGVCAGIRIDSDTFELAKMAVSPSIHGRGIGKLLGEAVVARAKDMGAKRMVVESNTVLAPAICLYRKLGFVENAEAPPSPYERCNIQMILTLE